MGPAGLLGGGIIGMAVCIVVLSSDGSDWKESADGNDESTGMN